MVRQPLQAETPCRASEKLWWGGISQLVGTDDEQGLQARGVAPATTSCLGQQRTKAQGDRGSMAAGAALLLCQEQLTRGGCSWPLWECASSLSFLVQTWVRDPTPP